MKEPAEASHYVVTACYRVTMQAAWANDSFQDTKIDKKEKKNHIYNVPTTSILSDTGAQSV